MTDRVCVSCYKPIGNIQKALEMDAGGGLVMLVCEACQLEAMPKTPIQKGGGEVRIGGSVKKAYSPSHTPQWVQIEVSGQVAWKDVG